MKYFYCALFFVCMGGLVNAQVYIKPKAGGNLSFLSRPAEGFYSNYNNPAAKLGFHAGVAIDFTLEEPLSFQAEVLYNQKGLKDTSLVPTSSSSPLAYRGYGFRFHYLEMPLSLRYALSNKITLGTGAFFSHLLKPQLFLGGTEQPLDNSKISRFDWGMNCDVSYTIKKVEVCLRYSHSLSTVKQYLYDSDPEIDVIRIEPVGKNRNVQLSIAYNFNKS